jgi:hypothetical protein
VRLLLERNGYAVELPTSAIGFYASPGFATSYSLPELALPQPVAGTYRLIAIVQLPRGNGATLVASVPLTLTP